MHSIYCFLFRQINVLQAKKKFEILDAVRDWQSSSFIWFDDRSWRCHIEWIYTVWIDLAWVHWTSVSYSIQRESHWRFVRFLVQMLSFMHAQYSLFQQGYNVLDEIDPYMKKLAVQVKGRNPTCTRSHACRFVFVYIKRHKMMIHLLIVIEECVVVLRSWTNWWSTQRWRSEIWNTNTHLSSRG